MDYLNRINRALDYIEMNLTSEIEMQQISKLAVCSEYYFQRIFAFMTGISLADYIRRRRLTLAAFDLQQSSEKIIDIALKYGYESPDAFTRAFSAQHGITPSAARKTGKRLKAYPRLSFHITIEGAVEMNYRIEKRDAFTMVGMTKTFTSPQESGEVKPAFWNELLADGTWDKLTRLVDRDFPGVHGFIKVIDAETVDYSIACVSSADPPLGMEQLIIPSATWAVFELTGPPNSAMEEGWRRILTEWLPTSGYRFLETGELECFPSNGDRLAEDFPSEIWIPIEKI